MFSVHRTWAEGTQVIGRLFPSPRESSWPSAEPPWNGDSFPGERLVEMIG